MRLSPIQLLSSTFERASIEVDIAGFENDKARRQKGERVAAPKTLPFEAGVEYSNLEKEDESALLGMLRLRVATKVDMQFQYYRFEVVTSGIFVMRSTVPEERRTNLLVINGAAVLFGVCREWLRATTARCLPGVAVLPTVTFNDYLKNKQEAESQEGTSLVESEPTKG